MHEKGASLSPHFQREATTVNRIILDQRRKCAIGLLRTIKEDKQHYNIKLDIYTIYRFQHRIKYDNIT